MKYRFLLLSVLLSAFAFAQSPVRSGEFLYTVLLNKFATPRQAQTQWWHEYIEPQPNQDFFLPLLQGLDSGRIAAFQPEFPFEKPMTQSELHTLLHPVHEEERYDPFTEVAVVRVEEPVTPDKIISVTFHERWEYDEKNKTLHKTVLGIIPHILVRPANAYNYYTAVPLCYIPFRGSDAGAAPQVTGITFDLQTSDTTAFFPIPGCAMIFPQQSLRAKEDSLVRTITQTAIGKKTKLFAPLYPFATPMENAPVNANGIRFYESWSMNTGTMQFSKSVFGIVLTDHKNPQAFVPLNKFVPKPISLQQKIVVDTVAYVSPFLPVSYYVHSTITGDTSHLRQVTSAYGRLAREGKLPAYSFYENKKMDTAAVREQFTIRETYEYEDPNNPGVFQDTTIVMMQPDSQLDGWRFCERWEYDPQQHLFTKNIYRVALLNEKRAPDGEILAFRPFIVLPLPAADSSMKKPEYLVAKNVVVPVEISRNTTEDATTDYGARFDSVFAAYSTNYFTNVAPSLRWRLLQSLLADGLSGKLTCYDSAGVVMPAQQLRRRLDDLHGHTSGDTQFSDYALFNEIAFTENWYFNPATGQLYKEVVAVSFQIAAVEVPARTIVTIRLKP